MKDLKYFEKELNKCSKCGLCQGVCPIYKQTGNECAVSKGKFIMLNGVAKNDLELSDVINNYLNLCTGCGKCSDFCPAGIDACHIINTAKYEYVKSKNIEQFKNFLFSKIVFDFGIKFLKFFTNLFKTKNTNISDEKFVYFKGCVNQIFPNTDKYLSKIFKNKIEIIDPDFECCGLPFLMSGDMKSFNKYLNNNLNLIPQNTDFIITDCASCADTIEKYKKYTDKINNIKTLNWGEIIAQKNMKFKFKKSVKFTFHKPCHLKNDDFLEKIIKNCDNAQYIKMNNYDDCCGFAGSFAVKNFKISQKILKEKIKNIEATNADYVVTVCPSCLAGLKQGLLTYGNKNIKAVSLLEFLAMGA